MEDIKDIEVGELQTEPLTVPNNYNISKIVGVFNENEVYEVFIIEKDKVGTITIRDVLRVSHLATAKTSSLIKFPTKLSPTTKLGVAARILTNYRLRALPIVDGKKVTGVITEKSILEQFSKREFLNLSVKSLTSGRLMTITETDTIAKARNLMLDKKIDHLPVLSEKKINGMITSSQIVFRLVPRERIGSESWGLEAQRNLGYQVKAIMENEPLTCQASDKASDVLNKILKLGKTYALVTVLDMAQGIVTIRDFIKLVAEPEPKQEIPVYIIGLPDDPFEAEVAKSKFLNVIKTLRKAFPEIEEARSVIKISESVKGKERRRYEVDVAIKMPKGGVTYTHKGWELPDVYDELAKRLKRPLAQKKRFIKRERKRRISG